MSRPRLPLEKAVATGARSKNPARYRPSPTLSNILPPIGDPPEWMSNEAAGAWRETVSEIPWLNRSHRALLEITAILRARLQSGAEVGTKALQLLRLCLGSLGGTPVDASKVSMPATETEEDPAEQYFR